MLGSSSRSSTLPFGQIGTLMGVRLAEPIAYTVIFPFINQMVEELGVTDNPDKIGFYSGLVESCFALVQSFTVYHWATLSDRIGRKPVILSGLTGASISISLFGLSTSFWGMIVVRSLSGALNGNVAVIKAAIGDITDETNSVDAFAMYGLTWQTGSIIGNAVGGTLSHPYERFPALFGDFEVFRIYPYLLPCLVATASTLIGITFAIFVYRESLPSLARNPNRPSLLSLLPLTGTRSFHRRNESLASATSETETLVDPGSPISPSAQALMAKLPQGIDQGAGYPAPLNKKWGFWELMAHRPVQIMSCTMFLTSFVQGAWGAVSLLFFFDKNNGLGMSASAIGTALSINGLWTIACQLLVLNRVRRLFGIARAYKVLSAGWLLIFFLLPLLRPVMEATETPIESDNEYDPVRYPASRGWITSICVNLLLCFVTLCGMGNSLLMVLINYSSPDKTALGAVNGIQTSIGCMARVAGPSLVSALFAISMDGKVLGGRLWWIFMVGATVVNLAVALLVKHDEGGQQAATINIALDDVETSAVTSSEEWDTGSGRYQGKLESQSRQLLPV